MNSALTLSGHSAMLLVPDTRVTLWIPWGQLRKDQDGWFGRLPSRHLASSHGNQIKSWAGRIRCMHIQLIHPFDWYLQTLLGEECLFQLAGLGFIVAYVSLLCGHPNTGWHSLKCYEELPPLWPFLNSCDRPLQSQVRLYFYWANQ